MDAFIDDYLHKIDCQISETELEESDFNDYADFERFLHYAHTNPDTVKTALEVLKKQKRAGDEVPPPRLQAVIPLDDAQSFPTHIKDKCTPKRLWEHYTPETLPAILVCADIDSVYTFENTLASIVDLCGKKTRWVMPSITRRESADTGSRFCVNADLCETKPFLRGGVAKTVPLNWFPNIKLAIAKIGHPFHCDMHVQMYFLGVEGFSSNSYFNNHQLGVVNAMFNLAIVYLINGQDTDFSVKRELQRFYNLETLAGSKEWRGSRKAWPNSLSPKAMKALAEKSIETLQQIASDDEEIDFENPYWNGIRPEDKRTKTLDRDLMVECAQQLSKNVCFTASMAGCKGSFAGEHFERRIELNAELFKLDNDSDDDSDDESTGFQWDTEACQATLNQKITEARNELKGVLWQAFQEAFDSNSPIEATSKEKENQPRLHKSSNFYVDCGIEIALDDPQMNMFSLIGASQEILKAQLREQ